MNRRRSSLASIIIVLAAVVIVLAGIHFAAPILNPILFALVLSLLFSPLYHWLRRKGTSTPIALLLMLVGLLLLFGVLFGIMATSATSLASRLPTYTSQLDGRLAETDQLLQQAGLNDFKLQSLVQNSTIVAITQTLLGGIASFLSGFFFIIMTTLFFLAEGSSIMKRLGNSLSGDRAAMEKLSIFGQNVVLQFGLRGIVNAVTAVAVVVILLILGVDFPLLWGVLLFFLSYIPYVGTFIAAIPPVILALAESGLLPAVLVILGFTVANILAENVLSPLLMGRGLNLSPTAVFIAFALWVWLLGGPGAFLAMPLTFLMILLFDSFTDSRWLADVMMVRSQPNQKDR